MTVGLQHQNREVRLKDSILFCLSRARGRVIFFLLAFLILSLPAEAKDREIPFFPGEKLVFHVRWGFIPAGEAVLEILPITTVNNIPSYHFSFTARTSKLADIFYKVRDRIDAYTDHAMTHSLLYSKHEKGKRNRRITVNFDWEKNKAFYTEIRGKDVRRENSPVSLLPGSFDPLSIFYAFRLLELGEGLVFQSPVTDGKRCVMGKLTVIKRENITVRGTTYDTFLVEPDLEHLGGVFDKKGDAKLQIWVTADGTSIPVRIESEVAVGSFVAELVEASTIGWTKNEAN
jgi:hypothetical protein